MESKGKLIILLVAGLIVAFAAIAIYNRVSPKEPPPMDRVTKVSNRVIIAKRDIPPGSLVSLGSDIDWRQMAPENIKESYLREGNVQIEDFNGAVVRKQVKAGEPLTASSITRAGEGGFLSAVLEPGMRAVSIAVNPASGNAGFIAPGDRVDLIVTHHGEKGSENSGVTSETFVRDVRVVAVDQMLDNPENKAILAKTVTVEVSPRQAEQVAVATEMGKISIALRSLANAPPKASSVPGGEEAAAVDLYTNEAEKEVEAVIDDVYRRVRVIRGQESETIQLQ